MHTWVLSSVSLQGNGECMVHCIEPNVVGDAKWILQRQHCATCLDTYVSESPFIWTFMYLKPLHSDFSAIPHTGVQTWLSMNSNMLRYVAMQESFHTIQDNCIWYYPPARVQKCTHNSMNIDGVEQLCVNDLRRVFIQWQPDWKLKPMLPKLQAQCSVPLGLCPVLLWGKLFTHNFLSCWK